MPTYEYECRSCGQRFEFFQNIKAEPLKSCPKCNGNLTRLIGMGSGIIFVSKQPERQETPCPKIKEGCSGCA